MAFELPKWNKKESKPPKEEAMRKPGLPQYEPFDWRKFFTRKKYIPWWILLIVILVLTVLLTVYHKQIVNWLKPVSQKISSLKWGWVIPIIILFVISFPPLFGHEIVAVLCGIVYGLWIGFAIVAAGTFLGEIGTYFAFKGFLRGRAEKEERRNLNYACLATVTREGGFIIVFLARLSAIPSHLTTAVFATCGVSFWVFFIATVCSLPKQLITVYLGVIINNDSGSHVVSDVVLGITFVVTLLAAGYIYWQMRKVRPRLIAEAEAHAQSQDTTYQGAGGMDHDDEMGSPLIIGPNGPQPGPAQKPISQGAPAWEGQHDPRYEPFRQNDPYRHGGREYEEYQAGPYQGQESGVTHPYAASNTWSANVSHDEFSDRPVQGKEMV